MSKHLRTGRAAAFDCAARDLIDETELELGLSQYEGKHRDESTAALALDLARGGSLGDPL